jgi:hypothetical protein
MRALIIALALCCPSTASSSEFTSEAEATTKRFANALARFDAVRMVDEFHSDAHQFGYSLIIRIYETTRDEAERADVLKTFGVASLDELKNLSPKVATVRLFEFAFSNAPKEFKGASVDTKITIVGSLVEKDFVHVLYRSEADFKDLSMSVNVPSVVTLKRDGDRLKVLSTAQLETIKAKLNAPTTGP